LTSTSRIEFVEMHDMYQHDSASLSEIEGDKFVYLTPDR
jgi:hypothetical protein